MARQDPAEPPGDPLAFTPARLRPRRDGWTAARQIAFIETLAETCCVDTAAQRVGMSRESAYALARHPRGFAFARAWDAALGQVALQVETSAAKRSIHGVARPIFYRGEQVGEWREYDERLTMFLLRYRRRSRFGAWVDQQDPPPAEEAFVEGPDKLGDDPVDRLEYWSERIADWGADEDDDSGIDYLEASREAGKPPGPKAPPPPDPSAGE